MKTLQHPSSVRCISWHASTKQLLAACNERIIIWNNGDIIQTIEKRNVRAVEWFPTGNVFAYGDKSGRVFTYRNGEPFKYFQIADGSWRIAGLSMSTAEQLVILTLNPKQGQYRLDLGEWNHEDIYCKWHQVDKGNDAHMSNLCEGRYVLVGTSGRYDLVMWDMQEGTAVKTFKRGGKEMCRPGFIGKDSEFIICGEQDELVVWRRDTGEQVLREPSLNNAIIEVNPANPAEFVAWHNESTIDVWVFMTHDPNAPPPVPPTIVVESPAHETRNRRKRTLMLTEEEEEEEEEIAVASRRTSARRSIQVHPGFVSPALSSDVEPKRTRIQDAQMNALMERLDAFGKKVALIDSLNVQLKQTREHVRMLSDDVALLKKHLATKLPFSPPPKKERKESPISTPPSLTSTPVANWLKLEEKDVVLFISHETNEALTLIDRTTKMPTEFIGWKPLREKDIAQMWMLEDVQGNSFRLRSTNRGDYILVKKDKAYGTGGHVATFVGELATATKFTMKPVRPHQLDELFRLHGTKDMQMRPVEATVKGEASWLFGARSILPDEMGVMRLIKVPKAKPGEKNIWDTQ